MKIIKKTIDTLVPDPANVRLHSEKNIEAIKASLKRFGQQKPIVIDKDGIVIAGKGTLDAAKQLGWTEINCIVSSLDKIDKTAFAIADNRTTDLSEFDDEALAKVLLSLKDEIDLVEIGFSEEELNDLSGEWDSDIDINAVDNTKENLDGITSVIKISCPCELKDEVLIYIKAKLLETSFEGVHVE